jgi:hypothetical protein
MPFTALSCLSVVLWMRWAGMGEWANVVPPVSFSGPQRSRAMSDVRWDAAGPLRGCVGAVIGRFP